MNRGTSPVEKIEPEAPEGTSTPLPQVHLEKICGDAPLRLELAARIAFPFGGLTVSGLRKEIKRGRLEVEIIAGKQYVTLNEINRMRVRCRVAKRVPDCGKDLRVGEEERQSRRRCGSSKTEAATSPRDALLNRVTQVLLQKPKRL